MAIIRIEKLGFPWTTLDPFLFCVHHLDHYPAGTESFGPDPALLKGRSLGSDFDPNQDWRMYHGRKVPGFPYHPHKGFETVTIAQQGVIDHADSLGAAGRFRDGDVQWMTAGKGVLHSETFPLLNQDKENTLELFQIWLNLPKAGKQVEPYFRMLWKEEIPVIRKQDAAGKTAEIRLIAGTFEGEQAPAPTPDSWAGKAAHEVAIWTITLEANARLELPAASPKLNRCLYFYRGADLQLDGENLPYYHMAQLEPDKPVVLQNSEQTARLLFLQGKPIGEPVVQHGPFVMNTRAEIQQAFMEYQQTQFGGWQWDSPSPVHDPKYYRFARHADGSVEEFS